MKEYYNNKTILITGATGLIGSHLVFELMKNSNAKVLALSRSKEKLEELFHDFIGKDRFKILARNVEDDFAIEECVDLIFHAASPISGSIIKERPVDVISANIFGTKNYLEFLKTQEEKKNKIGKLIIFSSATVYANHSDQDISVLESETEIADSIDALNAPYSESKRLIEVLAKAYYKQYGIETVICRFSYLYGYAYFTPNTAFYEFINKAINGYNIIMNNSNIARRDNIFIDDAICALLILAKKGVNGESYNVSSNGDLGNYAAADEMARIITQEANAMLASNVELQYKEDLYVRRKPGIKLENSKLKELGWTVNTSLKSGIRKVIEEYLNINKREQ